MLTIQPNFSQRLYSQPSFRGNEDDTEDLELLKDDITDLMDGVEKHTEKISPKLKKAAGTLCLVGSGAVMGVGTKLGWNESGKFLKKIFSNPKVVQAKENLKNFGKKISGWFGKLKETNLYKNVAKKADNLGERFKKTAFGGKVCDFFKKIANSKPVIMVKSLLGKAKNVKAGQVADTTGDIVAFSAGVSTTAAGAISDKKKSEENKKTEVTDVDETTEDYDYNEDEENVD